MKHIDVIVAGELNVDVIMNHIWPPPQTGKEVLAKTMEITLGSSSAIFAANLSVLGSRVSFVGKVGDDIFSDLIIRVLQSKKVDTSHIIRDNRLQTGATVVMNSDNDRAMVTFPGAMEYLEIGDIPFSAFSQARHLHISSVFLQTRLMKDLKSLLASARACGLTTSLDTQWDPAETWAMELPEILPLVDVFLPNEQELMLLTGKKNIDEAFESVKSYVNTLVVKLGNKGSVSFYQDEKVFLSSFFNAAVVDAIGAGDSFNAGFIHKFLEGHPISVCQQFGNLAGAISTTAAGGTGAFTSFAQVMETARKKFNYH